MKLRDYWKIVQLRKWSIFLLALLGAGIAATVTLTATPQYQATSSLYFSINSGATATDLNQGSTYTQSQMLSIAELATKPMVLQEVIEDLGLDTTTQDLAKLITPTTATATVLVDITVTDPEAKSAAAIANSVADHLGDAVQSLSPTNEDGDATITAAVVAEAATPTDPSSPQKVRDITIGFVGGLMLGLGMAILLELLNTKPRNSDEVADLTGAPVLTQIARDKQLADGHVRPGYMSAQVAESFRRMRTNLRYIGAGRDVQVVTITSSLPGEGKSTCAINFAVACAEAGDRVLLIDADLRKPAVARYLNIEGQVGLTDLLTYRVPLEDLVQPWTDKGVLDILASGGVPPNPTQLVDSAAMAELIHRARSMYDLIVIDSPPLLPVVDGTILARHSDGAVVVTNIRKVHREQVTDSVIRLAQVGAVLLGMAVNGTRPEPTTDVYGAMEVRQQKPAGRRRSYS